MPRRDGEAVVFRLVEERQRRVEERCTAAVSFFGVPCSCSCRFRAFPMVGCPVAVMLHLSYFSFYVALNNIMPTRVVVWLWLLSDAGVGT